MKRSLETFWVIACLVASLSAVNAQTPRAPATSQSGPTSTLLQIIRAEDERRWDDHLRALLSDKNARVRKRAALAAGRIGDERAVPVLVDLLKQDRDNDVRQMAAFAIGEIESPAGADALMAVLNNMGEPSEVRARSVEALGKIVTALPESDKERRRAYGEAILNTLNFEAGRRSMPDRLTILLGLTAALRTRPEGAGPVVIRFLSYSDPRILADTLNTMARLRLKDGNEQVRRLLNNSDPIVRANAARVIGAAEHKEAFDAILDRALHDDDLRVRVSAIRALGSLKDTRTVEPLVRRGNSLLSSEQAFPSARNELLEITTTLGRLLPNTSNDDAITFVRRMHELTKGQAVEVEIAFARIVPGIFQSVQYRSQVLKPTANWRQISRRAQGLAAIKDVIVGAATGSAGDSALKDAKNEIADLLHPVGTRAYAVPDLLQAYVPTLTPADAGQLLRHWLNSNDVIIRSTAAELIGNQPPNEANTRALIEALKAELPRTEKGEMNDAALAILEALAKQKNKEANEAIKTGLDSSDHLLRRKAVALLKANGAGDFSDRIGTVRSRNTEVDYRRAISRIGKHVTATVMTSKGSFTIEFLPEDALLTVDNFIQLARKGFFNGQTIPRVVANFVVQAGDPRGDTNGGPGYQIRCEINEVPYDRAAVGMALSGKDTGGSQWFVTHSPQPHLDGGYTVFGHVAKGMDVVDNISRGDIIRRVVVNER